MTELRRATRYADYLGGYIVDLVAGLDLTEPKSRATAVETLGVWLLAVAKEAEAVGHEDALLVLAKDREFCEACGSTGQTERMVSAYRGLEEVPCDECRPRPDPLEAAKAAKEG